MTSVKTIYYVINTNSAATVASSTIPGYPPPDVANWGYYDREKATTLAKLAAAHLGGIKEGFYICKTLARAQLAMPPVTITEAE